MGILEDAGMPYGVTPGNHDNLDGEDNALYNEFFPPSRYADQPYYGEAWRPGDNQNHYDLFEASGQEFVVVYLGFVADQAEIDWANEVLERFSDRKAIFATHEYLRPSESRDGRGGALSELNPVSQGEEFFDEIVVPNENVILVLSGHTYGVAYNVKRDVGQQGHGVVEMLANYQAYEVQGDRRAGFFRLLQFDVDQGTMAVDTYSPALGEHNADEYDPRGRYDPESDEFTVPVDLDTRGNRVATDAVRLGVRTDRVIGTDSVASGEEAATTWDGREPGTSYAWYASAADEFGGLALSPVFRFDTAAALAPEDSAGSPPPDGG